MRGTSVSSACFRDGRQLSWHLTVPAKPLSPCPWSRSKRAAPVINHAINGDLSFSLNYSYPDAEVFPFIPAMPCCFTEHNAVAQKRRHVYPARKQIIPPREHKAMHSSKPGPSSLSACFTRPVACAAGLSSVYEQMRRFVVRARITSFEISLLHCL